MVDNDTFPSSPVGLAYCRHLSTVRTHLSALVNHMIVSPDLPCDAGHGLTAEIWEQYLQDSTVRLGLARPAMGQRLCGDRDYGGTSYHLRNRPTCVGTQVL